MSKWNNGKSYSIYDMPKEEVSKAIKEWAEGCKPLESLLRACYKRKILTSGCHYGPRSFIDFEGTASTEEIKKMIRAVGDMDGLQLHVSEEVYNIRYVTKANIPNFGIGNFIDANERESQKFFRKIHSGLLIPYPKRPGLEKILDFYKFFEGRETGLGFRIRQSKKDGEVFTIETFEMRHNFPYYDELFKKAGLEYVQRKDWPIREWRIQTKNRREFDDSMSKAFDTVSSEWSIPTPTEIAEDMSLSMKLRILYKQKGQTPEGKREILEWFIANAPDGALKEFGLTRPKQGEQNPEQERRKQVILDRVERYFKPESDDRER